VSPERCRAVFFAALCASVAAVDQAAKYFLRAHPVKHWPWPGVFEFTAHANYGLIGDTPVPQYVILPVMCAIMAYLAYKIFVSFAYETPWSRAALSLILGGALGNLLDRLRFGFVFDWLMLGNTSILNLADMAIGLGILWYTYCFFRPNRLKKVDKVKDTV